MIHRFLGIALATSALGCTTLDLWDAPDVDVEERSCRVDTDCETIRFEVDPSLRNDPCLVAVRSCDVPRGRCTVDLRARDSDRDGYRDIECAGVRTDFAPFGVDCVDSDPLAFPDADLDEDGFVARGCGSGQPEDCDDSRATAFPGATVEACDGVVSACADATPPARRSIEDADGDRFAAPDLAQGTCEDVVDSDGQLLSFPRTDCDDLDRNVFPGAPDVCDGRHDDCDADTGVGTDRGEDVDGDGFASPSSLSCDPDLPGGLPNSDCDDVDPKTYPGALESCDGIINDCSKRPVGVRERPIEDPDGDGRYAGNASCIDPVVSIECINAAFDRYATYCLPASEAAVATLLAGSLPMRTADFFFDKADELVFARDDAASPCATTDQIVARFSTSPVSSQLSSQSVICDTVASTVDLALADADGDAPLEIVSLHGDGSLVAFDVTSSSSMTMTAKSPMGVTISGRAFAIGRIDGVSSPVLVAVEAGALGYRPLDASAVAGAVTVVDASVSGLDRLLLVDLDRDSLTDVVAYSKTSSIVSVYRGLGAGAFDAESTIDVAAFAPGIGNVVDLEIGDVEGGGDGDLDFVVAGAAGFVVLARGASGYAGFPIGIAPNGSTLPLGGLAADDVEVRDLDKDGRAEIVFGSSVRDSVGYLDELGTGVFAQHVFIADLAGVSRVAVGDFDLDFDLDVAAYSPGLASLFRYTSGFVSNPSFGARALDRSFETSAVATGDVDGDGAFDVAGVGAATGADVVLWRARTKDLAQIEEIVVGRAAPGEAATGLALGDVNGDTRTDFVLVAETAGAVRYIRGRGDLTFEPSQALPSFAGARAVLTADLDGDLVQEIVVASNGGADGRVAVYQWDAASSAFVRDVIATGAAPCTDVAVGDVDADGDLDVGVACGSGVSVFTNPGSAGGAWSETTLDADGGTEVTTSIDLVDVDRDGDEDVVSFRADLASVRIDRATNGGAFASPPTIVDAAPTGAAGAIVRGADIDRDGDIDLVLAGLDVGAPVRILQSVASSTPRYVMNAAFVSVTGRPRAMAILDIDGDLDQDFAVSFGGDADVVGIRSGGSPWWNR